MPAGLYYSQAEYEDRYGEAEAIRLTDETGNGTVDATKMAQAIEDASADMDTYLGVRYALPIAEPHPRVLAAIAAPLVREKLHGTFPTDMVMREADLARKRLADLSAGRAVLTVDDTGDSAEQQGGTPSGGITYSAPARTFSSTVLDKF